MEIFLKQSHDFTSKVGASVAFHDKFTSSREICLFLSVKVLCKIDLWSRHSIARRAFFNLSDYNFQQKYDSVKLYREESARSIIRVTKKLSKSFG